MLRTFKIDTGAEVSVINEITFNKLQDLQLKEPQNYFMALLCHC